MSESQAAAIRAVSHVAFRQDYRLELMVAIADTTDGIVCLTDLPRTLDVSVSNLQVPLKNLVELRLLTPLPRGDSRRKFYMRNESPAWQWARELAQSAAAAVESER